MSNNKKFTGTALDHAFRMLSVSCFCQNNKRNELIISVFELIKR